MPRFSKSNTPYALLPASSSGFSPLVRDKGESGGNLATIDAGDNGLYVGGGGINLAFGALIGSPDAGLIGSAHATALANARKGTLVTTGFGAGQPVTLISVVLAASDPGSGYCRAETVFLDIFAAGHEPKGEPSNVALVYAVPPCGAMPPDTTRPPNFTSDADFLAAVKSTAVNCVRAVADYNANIVAAYPALNLKPVDVLRTCLFSAAIFARPGVGADAVAHAIFDGFSDELATSKGAGLSLVEFENGGGGFDCLPK